MFISSLTMKQTSRTPFGVEREAKGHWLPHDDARRAHPGQHHQLFVLKRGAGSPCASPRAIQ